MEPTIQFPGTSIFARLKQHELRDLEKSSETRQYRTGEWITQYGDVWPYFLFINHGQVTVLKESYEGRSLVLTTLHPGEVFWGMAFFIENALMPASLQVSQDAELLLWSRDRLLPIFLKNGNLYASILPRCADF